MFELSRDVERLTDFLQKRTSASYGDISALIGREIEGCRHVLASARRRLERDGIFFITERGIGLNRATNAQVAGLSTAQPIAKVGRIARKAKKRQLHVNIQTLSNEDRGAFQTDRVIINAISDTTLRSLRTKIRKEIEKRDGEMISVEQNLVLPRLKGEDGKGGK